MIMFPKWKEGCSQEAFIVKDELAFPFVGTNAIYSNIILNWLKIVNFFVDSFTYLKVYTYSLYDLGSLDQHFISYIFITISWILIALNQLWTNHEDY